MLRLAHHEVLRQKVVETCAVRNGGQGTRHEAKVSKLRLRTCSFPEGLTIEILERGSPHAYPPPSSMQGDETALTQAPSS